MRRRVVAGEHLNHDAVENTDRRQMPSSVSARSFLRNSKSSDRPSLVQPHPPYPFDREIPQQVSNRNPKCPTDPKQDRETRYLRSPFEIAGVGRSNPGGFGELFLCPAGGETELAQALSEDLCFDSHVELSFNDR